MSSDSDDMPLFERLNLVPNNATNRLREDERRSSGGSPVPEWISQATPLKQQDFYLVSSEEEDEGALIKEEADQKGTNPPSQSNEGKAKALQAKKPVGLKAGRPARLSLGGGNGKQGAAATTEENTIIGEVPLVMPAKISHAKVVVELEAGRDSTCTDLTGDAGIVGRFFRAGTGQDEELQLDLKGVVYSVSVLPSATSLCVVNITQTEARVETLVGSFLQLRECSGPGGDNGRDLEEDHFLFDDDENYQVGPGGGDDGRGEGSKQKKKGDPKGDGTAKKRKSRQMGPQAKKAGKSGVRAKTGKKK